MSKIKIILWIVLSLFIIGIVGVFTFRQKILDEVIQKVIASEKEKHGLNIEIKEAKFAGLTSVKIDDLSVVPDQRDTLLRVEKFKVSIAIMPLFLGHIKVDELQSSNALLNIIHKDGLRNFDFLLKKDTSNVDTVEKDQSGLDIASILNGLINKVLYKVPNEMLIENYLLNVVDDKLAFQIRAQDIRIDDNNLNSTFVLNDNESIWHMNGHIFPSDKKLDLKFFADNKKVELPYFEQKFGLKLSFDTVSTRMDKIEYSSDELRIYGNWALSNLMMKHEKLAQKDVVVSNASIDCNMFFGEKSISIDSSSMAYLGKIKARPFIKYTLGAQKIYELKFDTEEMQAQDFFDSFPVGLFNSIEGIKVKGMLAYHLDFYLDSKTPWRCRFDSELKKKDFQIVSFGNTNFQKINGSFVHVPYEVDRASRPIVVGPENPNFVPYDQISNYIKNALLTTEDPLFFSHRGFYEEAFRQSIAANYVAKRFKRGGSTISMQLVKNVFLNRNKTVARKLEEMIIVWLIENNRLSSKQRMYEVYLNIIEWAPNVYGISEASRFYFNKRASELNLGESIFLASIVPKPKKFKYSFLPNGELKPYMHNYFKFIGGLMVKRGKIQEIDTIGMFRSVSLRGPARNYVVPDSLINYEEPDVELEELKSLMDQE